MKKKRTVGKKLIKLEKLVAQSKLAALADFFCKHHNFHVSENKMKCLKKYSKNSVLLSSSDLELKKLKLFRFKKRVKIPLKIVLKTRPPTYMMTP